METNREISPSDAADRLVILVAETREICRKTDRLVEESKKLVAVCRRTSKLAPLIGRALNRHSP
jgi:hypothetical protein